MKASDRMPGSIRKSLRNSFSLLEVLVALGIVTFALVGIFGLFSVGLRSNRQATDDTALATMSWRMVSTLRSATNAAQAASLARTNYFFDAEGQPATTDPYYTCRVALTNRIVNAQTNLGLSLQFTWPNVPRPPFTNIVNAPLPLQP